MEKSKKFLSTLRFLRHSPVFFPLLVLFWFHFSHVNFDISGFFVGMWCNVWTQLSPWMPVKILCMFTRLFALGNTG